MPPAQVRRSDVLSAWSGLRPLALDPNAQDTASASRDHVVTRDPDGMITVTGAACAALVACRRRRETSAPSSTALAAADPSPCLLLHMRAVPIMQPACAAACRDRLM